MKPTPTRSGVSIHTPESRRQLARRLDRRMQSTARAVGAMKAGACLRLEYGPDCRFCRLSNGWVVPEHIAAVLIRRPDVVAVGDALFPGHSQTWRYTPTEGGK